MYRLRCYSGVYIRSRRLKCSRLQALGYYCGDIFLLRVPSRIPCDEVRRHTADGQEMITPRSQIGVP